jgi:metal-responsive CopG/Arc/MetJ family transcriptional regulator
MKRRSVKKLNPALRASVSFPPDLYRTLEEIAKQKKVSVAWVVRDATEKYVADQWPLFAENKPS